MRVSVARFFYFPPNKLWQLVIEEHCLSSVRRQDTAACRSARSTACDFHAVISEGLCLFYVEKQLN